MKTEFNAIKGMHLNRNEEGKEVVYPKLYNWYINKTLRLKLGDNPIKPGDVVAVRGPKGKIGTVLVMEVFKYESDERLKSIIDVISRYEKKE